MTTITFNVPEGMEFGTKVNGEWLPVDAGKLHPSWLAELFRYGVQRKVNDHVAGQGDEKKELARAFIADMREEKPVRVARGASTTDPVLALARTTARKMLHTVLGKMSQRSKLADIVAWSIGKEQEVTVGKYLTIAESGLPLWNTKAIDAWIETKPGGRDLMAEARATLSLEVDDFEI